MHHLVQAFLLVFLREVQLIPELAHGVLLRLRDYSRQCCQDGFSSVSVSDAAVDFLDEFLRFGDSLAELPHHILVTLGVRVRHVVAKTDVAALHHAVEFRELAYNLRFKIKDTAVILPQLLNTLGRNETAAHQILQRTLRYPLGILHVALAARQLLDEIGIDKLQMEMRLKHSPDGNPIDCRALHRHLTYAMRLHHTTHITQLVC